MRLFLRAEPKLKRFQGNYPLSIAMKRLQEAAAVSRRLRNPPEDESPTAAGREDGGNKRERRPLPGEKDATATDTERTSRRRDENGKERMASPRRPSRLVNRKTGKLKGHGRGGGRKDEKRSDGGAGGTEDGRPYLPPSLSDNILVSHKSPALQHHSRRQVRQQKTTWLRGRGLGARPGGGA